MMGSIDPYFPKEGFRTPLLRRSLPVRLFWLAGIGCFLGLAFWPGVMSPDSAAQYGQAVTGRFDDWHPPVMAYLWSFLLVLGDGTAPMLCFHLAMLLSACCIMSDNSSEDGVQRLWLLIPILPWIIGLSGIIWKDVGMAFALFLSFALFRKGISCKRNANFILFAMSFIFFMYAMLVRANAITMAPPLVYYAIRLARPITTRKLSLYITCIFIIFLMISTKFINTVCIGASKSNPRSIMQIDEILETSYHANKNLFNAISPLASLSSEEIAQKREMKTMSFFREAKLSKNALDTNWKSTIIAYPLEYIKAKYTLFSSFSSFPFKRKHDVVRIHAYQSNDGLAWKNLWQENKAAFLTAAYTKFFSLLRLPFLPIFWIPLSIYLFFAAGKIVNTEKYAVRMLSGSSICYYLGYLLVTPPFPEYRFIYWTALGTTLSALTFYYSSKHTQKI